MPTSTSTNSTGPDAGATSGVPGGPTAGAHAGPARVSAGTALPLALVLFALALGLRMIGADHGLPHRGEADAYIVTQAETLQKKGLTDRSRAGWKYPHLVATLVAAQGGPPPRIAPASASLTEHVEAATATRLRTRRTSAFLSALAAPATFLVALRLLGLRAAFLAGLFVAFSLLHGCYSFQARPHGPTSAFLIIALLLLIRWVERPSIGRGLAMGAGCMGAVCALHTGLGILSALLVAVALALRSPVPKRTVAVTALLTATLIGAGAGWFYSRAADGVGMDPTKSASALSKKRGGLGDAQLDKAARTGRTDEELHDGRPTLFISEHSIPLDIFDGRGFGTGFQTLTSFDPWLLPLGLVGLAAALRRLMRRRLRAPVLLTAAYAVPSFLVLGLYGESTPRFFVVLVPCVSLLAAYGAQQLFTLPRAHRLAWTWTAATVLIAGTVAVRATWLRALPDTAEQAAQWFEDNASEDATVHTTNILATPMWLPRSEITPDIFWSRGPWERYQLTAVQAERAANAADAGTDIASPRPKGIRPILTQVADQIRIVLGPDRPAIAKGIIAAQPTDYALVATSKKAGTTPVPQELLLEAWRSPFEANAWEHVATFPNGLRGDTEDVAFQMRFLDALRSRALGQSLALFRRR